MKHYIPDNVMRWLGPTIIIAIGTFAIVGNPVGQDLLCDKTQNCLATWVGALSGWAAAGAAAITIKSLFQQAKAAQKQADFQLGDASPSIDAVQHAENSAELVVRVTNWNRRGLIIRQVEVPELYYPIVIYWVKANKKSTAHGWDRDFAHPLFVDGWVDRSGAPTTVSMKLGASNWEGGQVSILYEMAGEPGVKRLTAVVHMTVGDLPQLEE